MEDHAQTPEQHGRKLSRRDFVVKTAAAAAAFTIVPRHVLGGRDYQSPSDTLNIAGIGVGGMGKNNVRSCAATENIYALCDVDKEYAAECFKEYPKAKKYTDYRKMLEKEPSIDAVIVATPDHNHAHIAIAAMKEGKHAFVQKPLTTTIYEARKLKELARKYKVATQMGNQGHAGEGNRLMCEWVADGAIGPVREVHCWTNRPIWPQGLDRPEDTPRVPRTLDWDLWLGPAAVRPYHPAYHPFAWRGWWDFGTGALGDMACHIMDTPVWALNLGHATSAEAISTPVNSETAPKASIITYNFPARGDMPPVKMTWYDGELMPRPPDALEEGRRMGDSDGGVLLVGDKGTIMCGCYGLNPRLVPESAMQAYEQPEPTIPRSPGIHEEWIRACKGGEPASSNFEVSGTLTEIILLGNLSIRSGKRIEWDGPNMKVLNVPEAQKYVTREFREPWVV
ncbi:MAG: Gfo/Idh/MocA family oxidoreductase [Fidelibacterota bacterium]|nr:MAG: Gfo/Idh/MocA family oxidoreductase [Candidatus Neomarinimicrobiota bacterium]